MKLWDVVLSEVCKLWNFEMWYCVFYSNVLIKSLIMIKFEQIIWIMSHFVRTFIPTKHAILWHQTGKRIFIPTRQPVEYASIIESWFSRFFMFHYLFNMRRKKRVRGRTWLREWEHGSGDEPCMNHRSFLLVLLFWYARHLLVKITKMIESIKR